MSEEKSINLTRELQRGYLMFKAFENGLEIAEQLKGYEAKVSVLKREIGELEQVKLQKLSQHSKNIDNLRKEYEAEEAHLRKGLQEKTSDLQKEHDVIAGEVSSAKAELEKINKQKQSAVKKVSEADAAVITKVQELNALEERIAKAKQTMAEFLESA